MTVDIFLLELWAIGVQVLILPSLLWDAFNFRYELDWAPLHNHATKNNSNLIIVMVDLTRATIQKSLYRFYSIYPIYFVNHLLLQPCLSS